MFKKSINLELKKGESSGRSYHHTPSILVPQNAHFPLSI